MLFQTKSGSSQGQICFAESATDDQEIPKLICDHNKITKAVSEVREFEDLLKIGLKGESLQGYLNDWDDCLLGMRKDSRRRNLGSLVPKAATPKPGVQGDDRPLQFRHHAWRKRTILA